jgi:hypothetical protein
MGSVFFYTEWALVGALQSNSIMRNVQLTDRHSKFVGLYKKNSKSGRILLAHAGVGPRWQSSTPSPRLLDWIEY